MVKMKGHSRWSLDKGVSQRSDLELLKTGLLADAEVKCGDRTWRVHKIIICTRSEWFKKALLGPFEEGQTGKVTITAFTKDEVDYLLHFLYTGTVNFRQVYPEVTILVAMFKVWKLADFFCLDTLDDLLAEALNYETKRIAKFLCSPGESGDSVDSVVENEVLPAIKVLYQADLAAVRDKFTDAMLGLVITVMHRLQPRKNFQGLFREIPEFAVDWATAFVGAMDTELPVFNKSSYTCLYCSSPVRNSGIIVDGFKWIKRRKASVVCSGCFLVPALSNWTDSEC